ncbi:MAG: hypothetical protein C0425_08365 [Chlorobiaceae bacterium]|nr:hypothetical protein [Chlorobiaceae bacterium]MBA4310335.1 hypothetical protein [Chlorobiaceae bacterium]
MIKYFLSIATISFLLSISLHAQTPSYYHYTTSDGLASSTVFSIVQDRDGYIWLGTLNGLNKFDGKRFTTYRMEDGLNSNSITNIVAGDKDELFIGNFEKGINVFKDGKIENYRNEIDGQNFTTSFFVLDDSEKNQNKLLASFKSGPIFVIKEKTKNNPSEYVFNPYPIRINRLAKLSDKKIVVLTTIGLFSFNDDKLTKLNIAGLPDTNFYCLANAIDGSFVIGSRGMIYQIKNNRVIKNYKINLFDNDEVSQIFIDSKNNIWFSIVNRGYFFIPNGSDKILNLGSKMDLGTTMVNGYLEDSEGNIWVTTFGKGVYCLNNLYLRNYNENDGLSNNNVYSIAKDKSGRLFFGTFSGISILENEKFYRLKKNNGKAVNEYIYSIQSIDDVIYVCWSTESLDIKKITHKEIIFNMFLNLSILKTKDGFYLLGGWFNNIKVSREKKDVTGIGIRFPVFGDSAKANRITEIVEDSKKNIWVGTSLGLCKLTDFSYKLGVVNWKKTFFFDDPVLSSKIASIHQDNKNNLWFAGGKGIARYNLENNSITNYTKIFGHDLSASTAIISDEKNRIWIGNMKGLYLFDGNSIKHLNTQTGLPSDEVYSLFYDKEKNFLYIGTSNGIAFLDINMFDNYVPSPLEIKILNIRAGDSVYTNFDNLIFDPKQNNVHLDFRAINFSSPKSVKYKYQLNGEWTETEHDFLDFASLKSGQYDFQLMAKAQNTDWSKPYFLSFQIKPRFVETIWFTLLIGSILVSVSVFVITKRLKLNNKKMKQELELTERINELKHQALSAMMNPHFIFNSLNSVQYLINSQRNEEANDYIAMMAKLVRKNLDTAGNGFILLSEEINRLRLYLDLEKLRFQNKFSYEIIFSDDVATDSIMIPNMIIQPFVENSLWHGILNSGKNGLLTISFGFENVEIESIVSRALIIKVSDDGIGIKEAKKYKREDHISKGIQIIEERLALLSEKMNIMKPIMFEDLSNRNENSHGTEVIISLPKPLYKIIP